MPNLRSMLVLSKLKKYIVKDLNKDLNKHNLFWFNDRCTYINSILLGFRKYVFTIPLRYSLIFAFNTYTFRVIYDHYRGLTNFYFIISYTHSKKKINVHYSLNESNYVVEHSANKNLSNILQTLKSLNKG